MTDPTVQKVDRREREMQARWDRMPTQKKIVYLRRWAKSFRKGGKAAAAFNPEHHEWLANLWDDLADKLEAGEDPFREEEESPEEAAEEAATAQAVIDLLKRHDAGSLSTLFKRWGIKVEDFYRVEN